MCLWFWFISSQYYYFDDTTSTYPYQQWCSENLSVRVNTESQSAKAWRLHLILDPQYIDYLTSDVRTNFFIASTNTFQDWTSELSPSWKIGSNFSILQIDRKNDLINYVGLNWLYGTISFVPRFSINLYTAIFGMEYNGETTSSESTIETTLSSPFGTEIINPTHQYQHMTWSFPVLQEPCVSDSLAPTISVWSPINWASKQTNIWISLNVSDNWWSSTNVPYVRTGGWVGIGQWTWNIWNIDTQYGINISTLQISLNGNWQSRIFNGWTFATPSDKTWQFLDKNYSVIIPSSQLFDYWIEKPITMTVSVRDRVNRQSTVSYTFNQPKGPTLIPGTRFPSNNSDFVAYDAPIRFGVQDDWAGVNSGSIVVVLSGVNWTSYGPYVFSGNLLSLSGISSTALQPNWMVEVSDHQAFPWSWIILVRVDVRDMEWNLDTISDYSFSVRPSCSQLWCCDDKYLFYKNTSSLLLKTWLFIEWWVDPLFYSSSNDTWYIDCWVEEEGMAVYKWSEDLSWAEQVWFFDVSQLRFMWNNVKAVLSWSTIILSKIFDYWSLDQWWGWWWWLTLHKDNCPYWDNSPSYYDHTCEWDTHGSAYTCPVEDSPYSQELTDAFQFAYGLGITTMCPIENADIQGNLLRKHLAKMITEYAVTKVGMYPDITKEWCDQYTDMEDQSSEMRFYMKMVCQLGLMWLESDGIEPQKTFRPNAIVTRAQFGTILSRLIFGDLYNVDQSHWDEWYKNHLLWLKDHNIMTKIDDPMMPELRWWVMLMLQRTYESGIIDQYQFLHASQNSIRILTDF